MRSAWVEHQTLSENRNTPWPPCVRLCRDGHLEPVRWEGRPDPELHCRKGCGTSQRQSCRLCLETKPQAFMLTSFLLYLNKLVLHLPHPQYPDLVWPILQTPFRSLVLLSHLSVLTTGYYWFLPETFKTTPVGLCYTL